MFGTLILKHIPTEKPSKRSIGFCFFVFWLMVSPNGADLLTQISRLVHFWPPSAGTQPSEQTVIAQTGFGCMFGKCHRSIPNGQEGKSETANTLKQQSHSGDLNQFDLKKQGLSNIQVPDVKLTGIAVCPCAALDTTVNRCARDV